MKRKIRTTPRAARSRKGPVPAHPGHPDFALLKAEIRWRAAEQEVNYHHCADEVVDKFVDAEVNPRMDEIAKWEAHTTAGVAVKLRMLQEIHGGHGHNWTDLLFATMFAALKRLEPVEW